MDTPDIDCFDVEFAVDAIGSSAQAIRSTLARLRKPPSLITLYAKFTNVSLDVARYNSNERCRKMYNPDTRSMIVTTPGKAHDAPAVQLRFNSDSIQIQFGFNSLQKSLYIYRILGY
ncbi:hypothetical protein ACN38_g5695 [Penicillium nordicum]|uniref:Uncharacterized protein n=1 Tax=Penicillium nordicum TaxID=229535 RepID=A0A0M8P9C0_9EURO|nr:hypothetical protein ACN38_g5695 [Penicillium nordicum]